MSSSVAPLVTASSLKTADVEPIQNAGESVSEPAQPPTDTPPVSDAKRRRRGRPRKQEEAPVEPPASLMPSAVADIYDALMALSPEQRTRVLKAVEALL